MNDIDNISILKCAITVVWVLVIQGSLHAHVFPKMLRIPALNHSGRFVCSVSPLCVLLSLEARLEMFVDRRFEFHGCKNLQRFF